MRQWLLVFACIVLTSPAIAQTDDRKQRRERYFENRVRPLLIAKCYECHSDVKQESGLRLDSREGILRGGDSGPAAVVSDPAESLLMQAMRYEGLEMPPDAPLEEEEIEVFQKWVRMGMHWPQESAPAAANLGDQEAIGKLAKNHWAFQPIRLPQLPEGVDDIRTAATASSNTAYPITSPIDAFINARLIDLELPAAAPADRRTLIRRATMDVTGLPPTPDEIDAFVNDPAPLMDAFEKVVDRLLASPHYGERWGRYWLDLARYADTQDWRAQADVRYPFAYTFRDYVIDSLNDDKPYDRFLTEQIAADQLGLPSDAPELAALGLITVGPRFRNNRLERAADQIDVLTRGLMGLTVACARCHDHKYDPIPIEDYYSLYGVFASCEIPAEFPDIANEPTDKQLERDFRKQLEQAQTAMTAYGKKLRREAIAALTKDCRPYFAGYYDMHVGSKKQIRAIVSKHKVEHTAMTPLANSLSQLTKQKGRVKHPVWGVWAESLSISEEQFQTQREALLAKWKSSEQINPHLRSAIVNTEPQTRQDVLNTYAKVFHGVLKRWQQLIKQSPDADRIHNGADEQIRRALLGNDGLFMLDEDAVVAASRLLGTGRRKLGDLQKAIGEVYATHPGAPPKAMVIRDKEKPINPFVMLRGEPARRGDRVPRRFVSIVAGQNADPFTRGSGRAELAAAIASADNPLTARVLVNRVWSKYFDHGLVDAADDFGLRSSPPSHPELLDWLAWEFMDHGWSLKWLHQTILSSAAYQRSSAASDRASEHDPENRYLSHQNRKRIDFEAMRDSMLAVSGKLDRRIGGRSVKLSQTPYSTRRTVYAYVDRVELDPMLRAFDFATPTTSTAQRSVTTVPQQSLFVMNHPFVIECAKELAALVRPSALTTDASTSQPNTAINKLFERVLGRNASPKEFTTLNAFLSVARQANETTTPVWQYGLGNDASNELTFEPLTHWTGQQYQFGDDFPDDQLGYVRLTAHGGNTPRDRNRTVVRRWVSPFNGAVRISGKLRHEREKGDGVYATVRCETVPSPPIWSAHNSESDTNIDRVRVTIGTTIDFVVSPGKNGSNDVFLWAPEIRCVDGPNPDKRWNASDDFAPPPVPPLDEWEQLAQALMLTNEFFYLD
ncbi:PSD1 and planctomycete cytochrome C domain-containing protein [Rhodopirellula sallentina]|uniref:Secreted protein containing DUF1549 n=1 Tax=Rhodopirellula sallentina SM41 TaxID=1263870 RepID=M5U9L6_9BACT|nr:PSD1 and planctomycete cytochrome C domain-containing protein [Rhodopirellula sallentina]EMI52683.1 secreted protein containing DUF1549 [Rhodopirellula sallentina SM41]